MLFFPKVIYEAEGVEGGQTSMDESAEDVEFFLGLGHGRGLKLGG
jgi:hypothetical protein